MTRWGVVATVKASPRDTLRFAAHHLDLGASSVHVYLDERSPRVFQHLKAHPLCHVTLCDAAYWTRLDRDRPDKHQNRQSINASRTYRQAASVDWIVHLDVDEFIVTDQPVADALTALPSACLTARIRPMEGLAAPEDTAQEPVAFKRFIPNGPDRVDIVRGLYPTFGSYLRGGFMSHVAGKVFVRTGHPDMRLRIHNAVRNDETNPGLVELEDMALAHCHATTWSDWRARLPFRHEKGAYRRDLAPAVPRNAGGLTLHEVLDFLIRDQGEAGLETFFAEVCADTPDHRARLQAAGLLRLRDLQLDAKLVTHFPEFNDS